MPMRRMASVEPGDARVGDPAAVLARAEARYADRAPQVDRLDGLSLSFDRWRFNMRRSNTEPLLRLNVETRGDPALLAAKLAELRRLIEEDPNPPDA